MSSSLWGATDYAVAQVGSDRRRCSGHGRYLVGHSLDLAARA